MIGEEPPIAMSLSRSEQARINGAKSRGPITPEGKTISSMNAFKHGCYSNPAPVLRIEDESGFLEVQAAYESQFAPRSPIEFRLVHELASVDWQLTRWRTIETAQIDRTYDLRTPAAPGIDPLAILSAALEGSVNESRFLPYIASRIGRLLAERNNALHTLRRTCPLPAAQPQATVNQTRTANNFVSEKHPEKQSHQTESKPLNNPSPNRERTRIEHQSPQSPHVPLTISAPHQPQTHPNQPYSATHNTHPHLSPSLQTAKTESIPAWEERFNHKQPLINR